MNLFKWIDELFVGKRDWDSFSDADKKSFSPFMINPDEGQGAKNEKS